jgi:hypothetical protein
MNTEQRPITCVVCGRERRDDDERGWLLTGIETTDEDEQAEAIFLCPECTAREFGPPK